MANTTKTTFLAILVAICVLVSVLIPQSTATAEDISQVKVHKRSVGSLEWIRNYLISYYEAKAATEKTEESSSTGRQMPTQSSLGDAVAVAGLGLLFANQLAVALNLPFLLPFMLIPVALLTLAVKLLSNADQNNEMVTQYLRASASDNIPQWNYVPQYEHQF